MVWCEPGKCTVLELKPHAPMLCHFELLNHRMGLTYRALESAAEDTAKPGYQGSDFAVDIGALIQEIQAKP